MKYFVACLLVSCSVAFGMNWQTQQRQWEMAQQQERERQALLALQIARNTNSQVTPGTTHGASASTQCQVNTHNTIYSRK